MASRLRRNRQTMLLQKRGLLSGNELFEMMRSRQVCYDVAINPIIGVLSAIYKVQNELRKDLDRTLRALKQAEKMQLAGLRIQKAIFLKRKSILDTRKRRLRNGLGATKNKIPIYSHLHSGNRRPSAVAEIKHGCQESSTIIQSDSVATSRQTNGGDIFPSTHNDHRVSYVGIYSGRGRPSEKSEETAHVVLSRSTVNSEWMCSIQKQLQKSNLQTESGTDSLILPHDHCEDKSYSREILKQQSDDEEIQATDRLILSKNNNNNNNHKDNELPQRQYRLLNTGGENNINESYRGEKQKDETIRACLSQEAHLGKHNAKLRLGEPTAVLKYVEKVRESNDQIKRNAQLGELAVTVGMQVLSLNERSNELPANPHSSRHQVAELNPDRRYSDVPHNAKQTPSQHAVLHKDVAVHQVKPSVGRKELVLGDDHVHRSVDVKPKTKQIQLNMVEETALTSNVHKETDFKPGNKSGNVARKQMSASPDGALVGRSKKHLQEKLNVPLPDQDSGNSRSSSGKPYLDRSKRNPQERLNSMLADQDNSNARSLPAMTHLDGSKQHLSERLNAMLADHDSRNSRSSPGSLERNVTMIFVEDPSVSRQDPPKSQFDFEAWLAYNKRKRGYTTIFDDKSSIVTSDDTSTTTSTIQDNRSSSKNRVRFDFPKRLALPTPVQPDMLTFREKSKEWYLNFLKKKKRHSEANKHLQKNIKVTKYASNQLSYAMLPNISTRPDHRIGDDSGRFSANVLSREATDEKLQRLKDYSNRLQVKVHDFVYS